MNLIKLIRKLWPKPQEESIDSRLARVLGGRHYFIGASDKEKAELLARLEEIRQVPFN
jgi:hypothetical protein